MQDQRTSQQYFLPEDVQEILWQFLAVTKKQLIEFQGETMDERYT